MSPLPAAAAWKGQVPKHGGRCRELSTRGAQSDIEPTHGPVVTGPAEEALEQAAPVCSGAARFFFVRRVFGS